MVAQIAATAMARKEEIANSRNIAKRSNPVKSCSADLRSKFQKFRPPLEAARGLNLVRIIIYQSDHLSHDDFNRLAMSVSA